MAQWHVFVESWVGRVRDSPGHGFTDSQIQSRGFREAEERGVTGSTTGGGGGGGRMMAREC